MAGTIITDRIESDATYDSKIELVSPVLVSNTFAVKSTGGTGVFNIVGANTNTDRTFTLPDVAGTVALSGTSVQTFDASGTWTKPTVGTMARIQVWGAGGGGSRQATTSTVVGGGGGGYSEITVPLSSLASTESVTVGAGGVGRTATAGSGTDGGTSTFGSLIGASGGIATGTSNGGLTLASDLSIPIGSQNTGQADSTINFWQGGAGFHSSETNIRSRLSSTFGGGGGGGVVSSTTSLGGSSTFGGFGANGSRTTPNNGLAPGGGGGGSNNSVNGGDGAAGRVIVTVW
jgi:hypothetical protein